MSSLPLSVLIVRDRPVGYQPSRFGGSLVAIERGYFPVSPTGYYSLARCLDGEDAPPPSLDFLEELAIKNDRHIAEAIRRTRRLLNSTTPDGLAYFEVGYAVNNGFFATDADRIQLWRSAYLLADRILRDEILQPNVRVLPNWSQEQCDRGMNITRITRTWLRELLTGNIVSRPDELNAGFGAYWELPPRPTPEPIIGIPEIASELSLDLPTVDAGDVDDDVPDLDDEDADDVDDDADESVTDDPELETSTPAAAGHDSQQLALF